MIINENELKKKNKITIVAAVVISIFLLILVVLFRPAFPYFWSIAVEFVCGAILAVSLGLCINEETRLHGILYASLVFFTPLISIVFGLIVNNPVSLDLFLQSYGAGFVLGGIYTLQALRRGKSSKLGTALPKLLIIFVVLISLIILGYVVPPYINYIINYGFLSSISSEYFFQNLFSVFGLILIVIILKFNILIHNIGIDGSSVFVIGPPSSGKTYLAIGLWDYFSKCTNIIENETPALNMENPEEYGDSQRLSNLHEELLEKGTLPHTKIGQLSTYEFILKKLLFIPIRWIVMDYPGEKYTVFHLRAYNKAMKIVLSRLKEIDSENKIGNRGWTEAKVEHLAETLELISLIQEEYAVRDEEYTEFMESVVTVIMYVNFRAAGKIIFLIDGNQFKNEWLKNHGEDINRDYIQANEIDDSYSSGELTISLNKALGEYNLILSELSKLNRIKMKHIAKFLKNEENLLKQNASHDKIQQVSDNRRTLENNNEISKKVAFLVTKTDILCNNCLSLQKIINKYAPHGALGTFDLSEIRDNKPATEELEKQLFNMLIKISPNFRLCMKKLNTQDIPSYFIAGSLDASARMDENPGKRMGELNQFGFSSIEEFGK